MHSMPASTVRRASVVGSTAGIGSRRVRAPSKRPPARRHLSKNGARSHTRSLMRGRLRNGSTTSRPSPATSFTWLRQVHRARPFTVIAHEPHTPDPAREPVRERGLEMTLDPGDDVEHRLVLRGRHPRRRRTRRCRRRARAGHRASQRRPLVSHFPPGQAGECTSAGASGKIAHGRMSGNPARRGPNQAFRIPAAHRRGDGLRGNGLDGVDGASAVTPARAGIRKG